MSTTPLGCTRRAEAPPPAPPLVVGARLGPALAHVPSFDGGPAEFVNATMDDLYPIFCVYRSMPQGEKGGLWQRKYYGKWVRWTGRVRTLTPNGLAIAQRPEALTFDVSLWVDADQIPSLRQHVKRGDRVTYIGRLESYDDVFQKLYLGHGAVLETPDP